MAAISNGFLFFCGSLLSGCTAYSSTGFGSACNAAAARFAGTPITVAFSLSSTDRCCGFTDDSVTGGSVTSTGSAATEALTYNRCRNSPMVCKRLFCNIAMPASSAASCSPEIAMPSAEGGFISSPKARFRESSGVMPVMHLYMVAHNA